MANAFFNVPIPINEPVKGYAPGSKEKLELQQQLKSLRNLELDIPMYIGGKEVRTGKTQRISPPHDHQRTIGQFHAGDASHVKLAIEAALAARTAWAELPWEHRAAVFLKAADLLAGPYRARINAATMLGQSKNAFQAEIDAACELIDFFRFNVYYMQEIYKQQPESLPGMWNRVEHRPLEGFVFALTPFNFTSIAGNLPSSAAMMGNVIVWKPANTQIYSAQVLMELFMEAGVPDGVINLVYVDGPTAGDVIFAHRDFAGIHFTGSTGVFQNIWQTIGQNIAGYKSYPRIVGETGGKDFILAHHSAHPKAVAVGMSRGAFEYQGQKCSAASRVYLPSNTADEILGYVKEDLASFKMGDVEDFGNFINAVIDEKSFDKLAKYIDAAKADPNAEIITGGGYDKSKGYFIEPTVIVAKDPKYVTMCEELFGPVLTVHVYDADKFEEALDLVDSTSPYALTGAVFAQDRYAIDLASKRLQNAAGNFYINDKPTGAVVGQQPFGGARASGTNDKAGSSLNLIRWVSPRAIKETFVPVTDYRYPFLGAEPAEDLNRDKGL
ncbi:1-pyrroline-5-carboxylate dehydrogenase [Hymenobacter lapidarius]|uniref:L-glutamate gamma-semialdehyde dehydrogenase n=1 Tax=Hymenobacter lapidarius TaxID=1908237 RepID=A0A1G1T4U1_9BACT|nr:L-glutamate gamma-semialdehyde dehydrogenase [Hymenobacter lapidarius]OGX85879.1 1-pyrroline-5-carboxylate dehydrogenase [Hymenobacter lapidarius]